MKRERLTRGDGHGKTSALEPAKCPCGGHLVIACENGCGEENPELGLTGAMDPIAKLRAPRTEEKPRQRATAERPQLSHAPKVGSTRALVLAAIAQEPGKSAALSARLGLPEGRVKSTLVQLVKRGLVEGRTPPGLMRGLTYHLAG